MHAVVDAMPPSDRHALVMKSTVPCGTGAAIKRRFAATRQGRASATSPARSSSRRARRSRTSCNPDRVVVGDDGDWAGDAVVELYAPLDAPLVRTDIRSAEMVKLASNAFLATKISFINEIANVCEEIGADVIEVARAWGSTTASARSSCRPGSASAARASSETILVRVRGQASVGHLRAAVVADATAATP